MRRTESATIFVLKGFLPYTRENLLLSFRPKQFFYELEKVSGKKHKTLRVAFDRAKQNGLLTSDKIPQLTTRGRRTIQPFVAQKLIGDVRLLVVFDIPEDITYTRQQFRNLLKLLGFKQVQRSVWITDLDHRQIIEEAIEEFQLKSYVQLFESARIFPR